MSLTMSLSAIEEFDWDLYSPDQTPEEEYFEQQAQFCLATGFVQPSEYDRMVPVQVQAWIEVLNDRNSANK